MEREKRKILAVILLLGLSLCLGIGTAWARYEKSRIEQITFAYQTGAGQIYLEKLGEPTGIDQQEFELSNGTEEQEAYPYDQVVQLTLFATEGLENPENCQVTLQEGGLSYRGKAVLAEEGSLFQEQYGSGWLYRFYNAEGEEISWNLPGGTIVHHKISLTVKGSSELPTALCLIADAKPGVEKIGIPVDQNTTENVSEECLLTEEGLNIMISDEFEEMTIPVRLSAKEGALADCLGSKGTVSVESNQEKQLLITADQQEITLGEEVQILNLTLKQLKSEEIPSEETKDDTPEAKPEEIQDPEETEEPENETDVQSIEETETKETIENNENTENKDPLSAKVTMEIGEKKFFAVIHILSEKAPEGSLKSCQSQYDPSVPLIFTASEAESCTLRGFVAGTRYRIDGKEYLLYQDGLLTIPAGKEAVIDISHTVLGQEPKDLELFAGEDTVYKIKYLSLPAFSEAEAPLIFGKEGIELSLQRQWGNAKASVTLVQLKKGEEGFSWEEDTQMTAYFEENDKIRLLPDNAPAGTYQMILSWKENEIILYQKEIPFFIQYEGIVLGGTENDQ